MQMLQSANAALRADELAAYRSLHARTFAVIPLSPKTGLIEWVEHSMPLFGVYRAWQRRTARPAGNSCRVPLSSRYLCTCTRSVCTES